MDFTESILEMLTTRKSSDIMILVCDGCDEDFSLTIGEIRRRLGKRHRVDIFCTAQCRRENKKPAPRSPERDRDSYGRALTPTARDDDTQNAYYNVDN